MHPLDWLCEQIEQHTEFPKRISWNFRLWVWWAHDHNFVVVNDEQTWGCIARPVSEDCYRDTPIAKQLYCYDRNGDSLWMDFLWAPGQWPKVREFLIASGKRWGGWEHRVTGKPHIIDIHKLVLKDNSRMLRSPEREPKAAEAGC
jgi:hypothetical protein